MPTIDELRMLQALPLDMKIRRTQQRIKEWVNYYGENGVYVSFSGGKDSTILLHLVRELYPNVEAVFSDTGLEYPEIRAFVKTFGNVTMVRPKMRFDEVIKQYGYPLIGKEVAEAIFEGRRAILQGKETAKLRKVLGTLPPKKDGTPTRYNYSKYEPLLHVDFLIGSKCCNVMKKHPMKQFEKKAKKQPIIATMADESLLRQTNWCRSGCNAFESNRPRSAPMSFWTEQDVLTYIKENNIKIASVYGDIVYDKNGAKYSETLCDCGGKLCTTGCQRTGCVFCGYGASLEKKGEGRFERLKKTHPRQYKYCMEGGEYSDNGLWVPNKQGLGMKHVIDEVNKLYGKDFIRY